MKTAYFLKMAYCAGSFFGETGIVKYYQNLIPKQLIKEILCSLHGKIGRHPGIAKTKNAYM